MNTLEVPVQSLSVFGGDLRIANDGFAITLHKVPAKLEKLLRELLDAEVPCSAYVTISREGVVSLSSVEATSAVCS